MSANMVFTAENDVLDAVNGTAAFTAPTTPMKVKLMTAMGDQTTAGTEVSGGSYASQAVTFASSSSGSAASNAALTYLGMPTCTVVGVEIWDSAGTPKRWWTGTLTASKTLQSGDTFSIASGQLTVSLT